VRQAEEMIRKLRRGLLVNRRSTSASSEYAPRSVEVSSAVTNPGVTLFPKEELMHLTNAIPRAPEALIAREQEERDAETRGADGKTEIYNINVDSLMKG